MIFRSPYPDIAIPDLPLTPFVLQHAGRLADKPALIDGSTGRTPDLRPTRRGDRSHGRRAGAPRFRQGRRLRHRLPEHPGVRARLLRRRRCSAASTTMVNPLSPRRNWRRQLTDAGARFVLTMPERLDVVREAAAGTASRRSSSSARRLGATPFAALLENDGAYPPAVDRPGRGRGAPSLLQRDDRAPKGGDADASQPCRQASLIAGTRTIGSPRTRSSSSRLPFFHVAGIVILERLPQRAGPPWSLMPRFELRDVPAAAAGLPGDARRSWRRRSSSN